MRKMRVPDGKELSIEAGDIPMLPGISHMIAIPMDKDGNFHINEIVVYK